MHVVVDRLFVLTFRSYQFHGDLGQTNVQMVKLTKNNLSICRATLKTYEILRVGVYRIVVLLRQLK